MIGCLFVYFATKSMILNTNFSLRKPERQEFDPLPEDTYEVEIEKLEDKERDVFEKPGEKEQIITFTFRIAEQGPYEKRKLWKDAPPVLWPGSKSGSPSTMYAIYSAVTGKKLNETECEALETDAINGLEGKSLRVVVTQKQSKKGEMRNAITGFLPLKNSVVSPAAKTPKGELKDEDIPVIEGEETFNADEVPF